MKNTKKYISLAVSMVLIITLLCSIVPTAHAETSCSTLYGAVKKVCSSGAKKVSKKSTCTFVTYSNRKKVKDFYFAADNEQVYCVCIVNAGSKKNAKAIKNEFADTLKANKKDSYLDSDQKKIVRAGKVGYSGNYAWYVSLSDSSFTNMKAVRALKKKI